MKLTRRSREPFTSREIRLLLAAVSVYRKREGWWNDPEIARARPRACPDEPEGGGSVDRVEVTRDETIASFVNALDLHKRRIRLLQEALCECQQREFFQAELHDETCPVYVVTMPEREALGPEERGADDTKVAGTPRAPVRPSAPSSSDPGPEVIDPRNQAEPEATDGS